MIFTNLYSPPVVTNSGETKSIYIKNYVQRDSFGQEIYQNGYPVYQMTMQSFTDLITKMSSGELFFIKTMDNNNIPELSQGMSFNSSTMNYGYSGWGSDSTGSGYLDFAIYGPGIPFDPLLPRSNSVLEIGEYPQAPDDRRKIYKSNLKVVFQDGTVFSLPYSGLESESNLKLFQREPLAPLLLAENQTLDPFLPLQVGDVFDIQIEGLSQTGYGGVTTQVAAKPATTFTNAGYAMFSSAIELSPGGLTFYTYDANNPLANNVMTYLNNFVPQTVIQITWSFNNQNFTYIVPVQQINHYTDNYTSILFAQGIDLASWYEYITSIGGVSNGAPGISVTLAIAEQTLNVGMVSYSLPGLVLETLPVVPYVDPASVSGSSYSYMELAPETTNYINLVSDWNNFYSTAALIGPYTVTMTKNGESSGGGGSGNSKKWSLPQSYIDVFNDTTQLAFYENFSQMGTIQSVQIATTDGLFPNSTNIDTAETYVQISNTKYYIKIVPSSVAPAGEVIGNELRLTSGYLSYNYDSSNLAVLTPSFYLDSSEMTIITDYDNESSSIFTGTTQLQYINNVDVNSFRVIDVSNSPGYISFVEVSSQGGGSGGGSGGSGGGGSGGGSGGSGGGGSGSGTSQVISTPIVISGKVVAALAVDPTQVTVRAMLNGTEQDLPVGSIVRNSTTGQKFVKVSGSATSFTAIAVSPKVEWEWSSDGELAWSTLQNT